MNADTIAFCMVVGGVIIVGLAVVIRDVRHRRLLDINISERERNIAEAVRTGIPCRPIANTNDVHCAVCGDGPCHGVTRWLPL